MTYTYARRYRGPLKAVVLDWAGTTLDYGCCAPAVVFTEVPEGRPAPWMCLENAKHLGVYPLESMVKVDDTVPGIEEGINAGMWTVGLAKSGNEIGLTEAEIETLPADEFDRRLARAYQRMQRAGADYVVDGIWDLLECLDDIEARLARGERPQHA